MTGSVTSQPHVPVETKGKRKTFAVVAGQWHLRSLVRAAVENRRTRVIEASNLQALNTIALGERLDLVILDDDLSRDDPMMAYDHLKRGPAFRDVPFILLTDRAAPAAAPLSGLNHPDRALHKHFSPFELLNLVYALTGY